MDIKRLTHIALGAIKLRRASLPRVDKANKTEKKKKKVKAIIK